METQGGVESLPLYRPSHHPRMLYASLAPGSDPCSVLAPTDPLPLLSTLVAEHYPVPLPCLVHSLTGRLWPTLTWLNGKGQDPPQNGHVPKLGEKGCGYERGFLLLCGDGASWNISGASSRCLVLTEQVKSWCPGRSGAPSCSSQLFSLALMSSRPGPIHPAAGPQAPAVIVAAGQGGWLAM